MGQAGVRVGVGTRFGYDGEPVAVVEMSASAHGNEILVRDGRDAGSGCRFARCSPRAVRG